MTEPHIVLNRIRTPDGTELTSYNTHDYKEYKDKNGHTYMVDGGNSYLRRNVIHDAPYEELSVNSDAPHGTIRESFHWGTYGKDGTNQLKYKVLKELTKEHICAILKTQNHIPDWIREIFNDELYLRSL